MKARLPKGMGGGPQNMNAMIRQAQKMQEDMKTRQEEIEQMSFKTTSGGGMVEVEISGKKEVKSILLKPEVVDPEDIEMLQLSMRRSAQWRSILPPRWIRLPAA